MRGLGFIAASIVLAVIAYLTVKRLKAPAPASTEKLLEMEIKTPANITELPAHAKEKATEALKKAEDRTREATEGL
jgi:hypothetical protein